MISTIELINIGKNICYQLEGTVERGDLEEELNVWDSGISSGVRLLARRPQQYHKAPLRSGLSVETMKLK